MERAARARRRAGRINLLVNYVSLLLNLVQGVLLVPLYLAALGPGLYGSWLATGNVLVWLTIIDPGVSSLMQQQVAAAAGAGDRAHLGRLIGASLLLGGALFAAASAAGLLVVPLLPAFVHLPADQLAQLSRAFAGMALVNAAMLAYYAIAGALIGMQVAASIGLVYVGGIALGIGLTVLGLLRGWGLQAIVSGRALTVAVWVVLDLAILVWVLRRERISPSFHPRHARPLVALARVTFLAKIGSTLAANLDAFLVNLFLGPGQVVVLSTSQKAIDVASGFVSRFGASFMPGLAHAVGAGETESFARAVVRLLLVALAGLTLICGGVVAFNGSFVGLWVGARFYAGALFTCAVAAAAALTQVNLLLTNVLFAAGNIRETSLVSVGDAAVRILVLAAALLAGAGLFAVPLASVAAGAGVSLWLLGRRTAVLVGRDRLRAAVAPLGRPVAVVAVLSLAASSLLRPATWPAFLTAAVLYSGAAVLLLLLARPVRAEVGAALGLRRLGA